MEEKQGLFKRLPKQEIIFHRELILFFLVMTSWMMIFMKNWKNFW